MIATRQLKNTAAPVSFLDLEVMARTVYGEARGEPWLGKVAVAWVLRTRAELDLGNDGRPDWWGEGLAGVAMAPWQFSCWNPLDKMRRRIEEANSAKLADSLRACFAVLVGEELDPTQGATHYYADSIPAPKWAQGRKPTAIIGHHSFFRLV